VSVRQALPKAEREKDNLRKLLCELFSFAWLDKKGWALLSRPPKQENTSVTIKDARQNKTVTS
jgi:hypothetical protein